MSLIASQNLIHSPPPALLVLRPVHRRNPTRLLARLEAEQLGPLDQPGMRRAARVKCGSRDEGEDGTSAMVLMPAASSGASNLPPIYI